MNLPPKALVDKARERVLAKGLDAEDTGLPATWGAWPEQRQSRMPWPGQGTDRSRESLPVLMAFQQYLDVERKKTRRQMIGMTLVFAVLLLLALGAAGTAAFFVFGPWREDVAMLQGRLSDVQAYAADVRDHTGTELSVLREQTERMGVTSRDQAARHQEDLRRMADIMRRLAEDNRALKKSVNDMKATRAEPVAAPPPPATNQRQRAESGAAEKPMLSTKSPMPESSVDHVENDVQQHVEFNLQPRGARSPVRWRAAIPRLEGAGGPALQ